MKRLCYLILFLVPLLGAMDLRESRHLLARTQFGATAHQVNLFKVMNREHAIDYLFSATRTTSSLDPLDWMLERSIRPPKPFNQMTQEEIMAFQTFRRNQMRQLRAWWMAEIIHTDAQLTEFMTLFWHNHFVSESQKVRVPQIMYRQNALLRKYSLGNFGEFLHEIAKDPAMIIYLDNSSNRKDHPNENFARELMELFTLGEGHYTENDIKESARAFTGYFVNPNDGMFAYNFRQHDNGEKEFLGETGRWTGDDIIDILLKQERTAEFITEKLWKVFINSTPDRDEVSHLAGVFRDSGYELKPLIRAILMSPFFWDETDRGSLVKSPVELVAGTWRSFEINIKDPRLYQLLANAAGLLGQNLLDPPNVKGWEGGTSWITTTTLLNRRRVMKALLGIDEDGISRINYNRTVMSMDEDDLNQWLLAVNSAGNLNQDSRREHIASIALDPAYQVK